MKQRIVYKVQMSSDKKRSKALSTAAKEDGVNSVKIVGAEEKDKVLVVIGDEVDIVGLAITLKKKVGCTRIVSVRVLMDHGDYDCHDIKDTHQLANLATNYCRPCSTCTTTNCYQSQICPRSGSDYYYRC